MKYSIRKIVKMVVLLSILGTGSDSGRPSGRAWAIRQISTSLAQERRSGLQDSLIESRLAQTSSPGEAH